MKDSFSMIKDMDLVLLYGMIIEFIMEIGKKVNNMEEVNMY
jgi:hypothetical protein